MSRCQRRRALAPALLGALLAGWTLVQPAAGQTVSGVGARECSAFTFAVGKGSSDALDAYVSWTQGFISAFNWTDPRRRDLAIDAAGIIHWLAGYCRTRPGAPFHAAVRELVAVHAR